MQSLIYYLEQKNAALCVHQVLLNKNEYNV